MLDLCINKLFLDLYNNKLDLFKKILIDLDYDIIFMFDLHNVRFFGSGKISLGKGKGFCC